MKQAFSIGRFFAPRILDRLAISIALAASAPGAAHAVGGALPRAWVSTTGADHASCGVVTNPCRTLQYAHDNIVAPGGSIYVKDPGNYGVSNAAPNQTQFVVTHSISVIAENGPATLFTTAGHAIDVRTGPQDVVLLKGLTLDGVGTASIGVDWPGAGSLTIANCTIKGFRGNGGAAYGVYMSPTGAYDFSISDTIVMNNQTGVILYPQAAGAGGTIRNVVSRDNAYYGFALGTQAASSATQITIEDSVSQRNGRGVYAFGLANAAARIFAKNVTSNNNGNGGFWSDANGAIYLTRSVAVGNGSADVYANRGAIYSYGDNVLGAGSVTLASPALR